MTLASPTATVTLSRAPTLARIATTRNTARAFVQHVGSRAGSARPRAHMRWRRPARARSPSPLWRSAGRRPLRLGLATRRRQWRRPAPSRAAATRSKDRTCTSTRRLLAHSAPAPTSACAARVRRHRIPHRARRLHQLPSRRRTHRRRQRRRHQAIARSKHAGLGLIATMERTATPATMGLGAVEAGVALLGAGVAGDDGK